MPHEPIAPEEYPLGGLTPAQFDHLTFLLARDEFPSAVHIRPKDGGLDSRLPDHKGRTVRGWQAKRFSTGSIDWPQCQGSVRRALAFWRPLQITFTFPFVLTGGQQQKFTEKLIDPFPLVRLDWWDGDELQRRIRDTDGGRRAAAWLFANPEADREVLLRAIAVGGDLSDAADAARRLAEVQKFMDRDPHLRYTTISSSPGAPETAPAPGTLLSVEIEVDGRSVRFDASERYPGASEDAGLGGKFTFADDAEGRQARAAFEDVMAGGAQVKIDSGVSAQFADVPVGLRGLMPEESFDAAVEISPLDSSAGRKQPTGGSGIPLIVRAADAELGLVFQAVEPPEGFGATIAASAGGLELFIALAPEEGAERRFDWRWKLGEGDALSQLYACDLMLAAYRGEQIEVESMTHGIVVSAKGEDGRDPDDVAQLESVRTYLAYCAEVEAWLGSRIEPTATPTDDDIEVLESLIARIRNPAGGRTLKSVELTLSRELPDLGKDWQFVLTAPLYAELFGAWHYVGAEWVHIPKGRFDGATGDETAGDVVRVVAADDGDEAEVRFYSPKELPEEAAKAREE